MTPGNASARLKSWLQTWRTKLDRARFMGATPYFST